jgi:hypothetical protein
VPRSSGTKAEIQLEAKGAKMTIKDLKELLESVPEDYTFYVQYYDEGEYPDCNIKVEPWLWEKDHEKKEFMFDL